MGKVLLLIAFVTFGCFAGITTDTVKAKGNTIVVNDTSKFLKPVKILSGASYGQIKIAPSTLDYEAGISFYRGPLFITSTAWSIGQSLGGGTRVGNLIFWNEAGGGNVKGTLDTNGNFTVPGTVASNTSDVDSIRVNGGSYLKIYITGSFPCSLKTSWVTVQQIGTAYYTRIGNVVTISFPQMTGTSNSTSLRANFVLPYNPKISGGSISSWGDIVVIDNNAEFRARIGYYEGTVEKGILIDGANFTASGTKGIARCSFTYICAD